MRILVTAGPTREPIDPVRYITNRSSGKMGYAIAQRAIARGHEVTLITGPVAIEPPPRAKLIRILTASDMMQRVRECIGECDALVMAAAVADWRPREYVTTKVKKGVSSTWSLELVRTDDVLSQIADLKGDRTFVGFAAETDHVIEEARRKLEQKRLDLIVANDVAKPGSGFEADVNQVIFIVPGADPVEHPLMSKEAVADRIVEWIENRQRVRAS